MMNLISRFLIILLCLYSSVSFAEIVVKEHPLSRNNFKLEFRSYEDPDISLVSYPDVLLIHGLTYSSSQFDINLRDYSLARALVKQGFRVWLLDITGYGQSEKPIDGFMVDTNYAAQDINNVATDYILRHQKVAKINLLGWSWGTQTTSHFAADYPQKINKLILYAPIIHGMGLPASKAAYQPFSLAAAKSDFQRNKKGSIDLTITEPDLVEIYLQQVQKFDGKGNPNGSRRDLFQSKTTQLIKT